MKKYYIIGSIIAIILFIIMFSISAIATTVDADKAIKEAKDYQSKIILVRYYVNDNYLNAEVRTIIITDGKNYKIPYVPVKNGYLFIGWYDSADISYGTRYTDSKGNGIVTLTSDILLYPIFEEKR